MSLRARLLLACALAALPPLVVAVALALTHHSSAGLAASLAALLASIAAARMVVRVAESPLRAASTVALSLREGDTSVRARTSGAGDQADALLSDLNTLADTLREGRLATLEAAALVRKITSAVPSALAAFDESQRLILANAAAERLLGRPSERLVGESADALGLSGLLTESDTRRIDAPIHDRPGPWEVTTVALRQGGRPVRLLVLSDIGRVVHDEERQAQQSLVRVLGHEINNSLGPIHSLAESLLSLVRATPPVDPDLDEGLAVIARRASSLHRFLDAYQRLARLPPPSRTDCDAAALLERVARLETRTSVRLTVASPARLWADEAQVEQALVNLVRNAADAALTTGGSVHLRLDRTADRAQLAVLDDGPGLAPSANLFVPFFTTKPGGSGIGLCLCREIAWAHGGSLTLDNRADAPGCIAVLSLPLAP